MKVLFVTRILDKKIMDGGASVSLRNFNLFKKLYGEENIDLFEIKIPSVFVKLKNVIFNQFYGQTGLLKKTFNKKIKSTNYDFVFFNGSLYGPLVESTKKNGLKSIVFYHNIEANYYKSRYLIKKNLVSILFYYYVKKNEILSTDFCDFRIVLNKRDGEELKKIYRKDFNFVLPISMPVKDVDKTTFVKNRYALFVGSNFFANQEGLSWFIEKVVPHISIPLYVAGSICDFLKSKYPANKKIVYLGFVDNLDDVYTKAAFIVSPIFKGSGMKTKTVEALSYGKYILGTSEAFIGIDSDYEKIGALCNDDVSFVTRINTWNAVSNFNIFSHNLFLNNYTDQIIMDKFKSCFIDGEFNRCNKINA
ncbi:glycosyltransferase family 4 protein [Treponema sp. HNW]|uniref:glycosyltransferase n=1 Tax=Treponema sp. HNW TaxID=3116654 RepID=UPI003D0D2A1F